MEDRLTDAIVEMAHHLGEIIKQDRRYTRYEAADKAFRDTPELTRLMTEYTAQQTALSKVYSTPDVDKELIEAIEGRVNTLYFQITDHPVFKEFTDAKDDVDKLLADVNEEILFAITGERPSASCGGDCSHCASGCSHSHEDEHIYD